MEDIVSALASSSAIKNEDQLESQNHWNSVKFAYFAKFCDKMRSTKDRNKKVDMMKRFLSYQRSQCFSFFPILRLIFPQWDRKRKAYHLKEHALAKKYIRVLALPKNHPDAEKLMNFKNPSKAGASVGDFADVVYSHLETNQLQRESDFTIGEVNNILSSISSSKSKDDFDCEFSKLVDKMSALEQKWLIRIILKEMHLGLGKKIILNLYHPDAFGMMDVRNDLFAVCEFLKDPSKKLDSFEITLFDPFKPMLSERYDIHDLSINETYFIETKWDGERFQLHYNDGRFKYYSRNAYDYTRTYGYDKESGILSKKIYEQLSKIVNSCILDGEMMAWSKRMKKFCTKGMNVDVKNLNDNSSIQPCFCIFDILYFNGKVMTQKPYHERMVLLDNIFTPLEGVIIQTRRKEVETTDEVFEELNLAIDNCEEGIILKHPESTYKPNMRNGGWIKLKPEYSDGAMVEIDLLIVGGYFGEKKQAGVISHFLLGLAEPPDMPGNDPSNFITVCRVSSGMTFDELEILSEKLKPYWKEFKLSSPPDFLIYGKEKPEFWIHPADSVILQVKATEVQKSNFFAAGYSLRFVRVDKIRYDKPWQDCMTITEFHNLRQKYQGKLTVGHIYTKADIPSTGKKRKAVTEESLVKVKVELDSRIFRGKEMSIITGSDDCSPENIKKVILQQAGRTTELPVAGTFCIIAGKSNLRVKNLSTSKKHNIIKSSWITRCVENVKLMPLLPDDFISMTPVMDTAIASIFDKYKNPENQDDPTYERILEIVSSFKDFMDSNSTFNNKNIGDLYPILFENLPVDLFVNCIAYFDVSDKIGSNEILDISHFAIDIYNFYLLGGTITSNVVSTTQYVIMHESFMENLDKFKKLQNKLKFKILSYQWIQESVASSCLKSHLDYLL